MAWQRRMPGEAQRSLHLWTNLQIYGTEQTLGGCCHCSVGSLVAGRGVCEVIGLLQLCVRAHIGPNTGEHLELHIGNKRVERKVWAVPSGTA